MMEIDHFGNKEYFNNTVIQLQVFYFYIIHFKIMIDMVEI
jgi:hypothetical protein